MAEELPLFLGLNDKTVTDIPKTVEKQRYMTSVAPKAANPGKWIEQPRMPIPTGEHAVIACSALKRTYRDILVHGRNDVRVVFLNGTQELIASRLAQRKGHFMPPGLLASQFSTLEPPDGSENPITVSIDASVEAVIDDIVRQLNLSPAERGTPRRNRS